MELNRQKAIIWTNYDQVLGHHLPIRSLPQFDGGPPLTPAKSPILPRLIM